jgi:nucleoside-diphosphate-sugar epimerase
MKFPKNIILTGHKGLIGRELEKRFIRNGYNIRYKIDARSGFNILDLKSLRLNQRTEPVDLFVHTAAYCKIAECIDNPEIAFENNVRGTYEVFEFCRKNKLQEF